jgi:hypothetical protein
LPITRPRLQRRGGTPCAVLLLLKNFCKLFQLLSVGTRSVLSVRRPSVPGLWMSSHSNPLLPSPIAVVRSRGRARLPALFSLYFENIAECLFLDDHTFQPRRMTTHSYRTFEFQALTGTHPSPAPLSSPTSPRLPLTLSRRPPPPPCLPGVPRLPRVSPASPASPVSPRRPSLLPRLPGVLPHSSASPRAVPRLSLVSSTLSYSPTSSLLP